MSLSKQNKSFNIYAFIAFSGLIFIGAHVQADLTTLAKNDANPPFSTLNLDDAWLITKQQLRYRGSADADKKKNRAVFSISPFAQNADKGKSIKGQPCRTPFPTDCPNIDLALGDLGGRSSMIALLYGKFPTGVKEYPPYLANAFINLFGVTEEPGQLNNEKYIDPKQLFGYFSFPLNYRKRGVRFELGIQLYNDLLIRIQAGVSSIRQVVENKLDLTVESETFETLSGEDVDLYLMDQLDNIMEELKLDISDLNQASVEEVRFNLCWRHAFEINENEDSDWSKFLVIPYAEASGSWSPGEVRKPNQLFAVPFGNNGHPSAGFTTGINFDFVDTIEIGGEVGYTHFFKKSFCDYPVPTSKFQTTLFPYQTDVSIQPGTNWHFGLRIAAYHFVENLSTYFEWFVVDHKKDTITLKTPDDAFLPEVLEQVSTFKTKMGNLGFNYDVSPNLGIGFLWQIPFSQRNTYRSSTLMAGINITF